MMGLEVALVSCLWPFPRTVYLWSKLHYTWTSQLALHVIHHVCKIPLQWCSVQKGRCRDVCHHVWLNGLKMVLMRIGFVFGPFFFFFLSVSSVPRLPGIVGKLRDADARLKSQFYVSQLNVYNSFSAQTKIFSFLYLVFFLNWSFCSSQTRLNRLQFILLNVGLYNYIIYNFLQSG